MAKEKGELLNAIRLFLADKIINAGFQGLYQTRP